MSSPPAVSVALPVRNGAKFLDDCLESLVRQTFDAFEVVALDDASTDATPEILARWARRDDRVRVLRVEVPLGLVGSANAAVAGGHAEVVMRMDSDDVSFPTRIERQLEVLHAEPDVVLVGSLFVGIDERGRRIRPCDRRPVTRRSGPAPFPHTSAAFRREAFDRLGGYRASEEGFEDRDLWARLGALGRVAVCLEPLVAYRYHSANASSVQTGELAVAHAVWSGRRPRPRDATRAQAGSRARAMAYCAGGLVSPRATRTLLRAAVRWGDRRAGRRVPPHGWCLWPAAE